MKSSYWQGHTLSLGSRRGEFFLTFKGKHNPETLDFILPISRTERTNLCYSFKPPGMVIQP